MREESGLSCTVRRLPGSEADDIDSLITFIRLQVGGVHNHLLNNLSMVCGPDLSLMRVLPVGRPNPNNHDAVLIQKLFGYLWRPPS
jgi:hypothetical protein